MGEVVVEVERRVSTRSGREFVAAYLADFTTTAEWDPHTRSCNRVDGGPFGVGSQFDNQQRIGPLRTTLRYRVSDYAPGERIELESDSRLMHATDSMTFSDRADSGTDVTYTARFRLKGPARLAEPILRRLLNRIADDGAAGMANRLDALAARSGGPGSSAGVGARDQ